MKNPSIDKSEITNVEGKPSLIYKRMPLQPVFLYNLYRIAGWNRAKGKKGINFCFRNHTCITIFVNFVEEGKTCYAANLN